MIPAPYSGPHAHAGHSVGRTMALVMLALTPCTLFGLYQFGWPAIFLFGVTVAACVIAEALCLRLADKPVRLYLLDGSAVLTGWLLALTLPPWAPWWIGVVGAVIAIVIGKHVFGGIGQNLFNPAMVARVALLVSFPLELTRFIVPPTLFGATAPGFVDSLGITFAQTYAVDAFSSATQLDHMRTGLASGLPLEQTLQTGDSLLALAIGSTAGSLGETSTLLIFLGGLLLLATRVISWHIPAAMLGSLAALATLFNLIAPASYPDAAYHIVSGATMLGAFFIATDLVTSPVSLRGKLIFGAGCGVLVFVIRSWAGYPEGVAFAVLLMNAATPLIDHYFKPRIYGRNRKGEPLNYEPDGDKARSRS